MAAGVVVVVMEIGSPKTDVEPVTGIVSDCSVKTS
jgi:hypothetical protein